MKFCYVRDVDKYGDNIYLSGKERFFDKIYKCFYKQIKVKGPYDIKDAAFNTVGKSIFIDTQNELCDKNMDIIYRIIDKENIEAFCFNDDTGFKNAKEFNLPIFKGEDIKFLAYFNKLKKMVKNPQKSQIGIIIDKNTVYEHIKMICEIFPLVIFFPFDYSFGQRVSDNILKDMGNSIYVSRDINSASKCELIFDLSLDRFGDKLNYICCENYISVYKKNEYVKADKIINNVKLKPNNYVFENMDDSYFDMSVLEGLLYSDNVIKSKKDILNVNLDEYLDRKSFKLHFFNES